MSLIKNFYLITCYMKVSEIFDVLSILLTCRWLSDHSVIFPVSYPEISIKIQPKILQLAACNCNPLVQHFLNFPVPLH